MPLTMHPEFGQVNERTFPEAALDADSGFRDKLEEFKRRGLIQEYRVEDDTLALLRPWIEGQTQEDVFRELSGEKERKDASRMLFGLVQNKLREMGSAHGAVHPRNIILRQSGGLELVDPVFNLVRMNPRAVTRDDPWLWGPCLPKGWSLENWDLVSLLRTTALVAQAPAAWGKPIPAEQAVEICRRWAEEIMQSTPASADFLPVLDKAVALLPKILEAVFELPVFPFDDELDELRARQGADRMLRQRDEESLADLAERHGLGGDQFAQRLRVWMILHGYRQEAELRSLAEELLQSGLYEGRMVSARACAAAERAFTHYGVGSQEAADLVRQLLAKAGWLDERREAEQCRKFLAGHLEPASAPPDRTLADDLATELAEASGLSPNVASRLVDLEIERRLLGLTQ